MLANGAWILGHMNDDSRSHAWNQAFCLVHYTIASEEKEFKYMTDEEIP